ncbi:hypothetical protein AX16_001751 [Volvariella volvacea WC 439]|nr:hypothetical protein AX16_001751 [Volvariella volvacea WC 439]
MDGVLEQQIRERNQEMDQMHPEKSAIPEKGVIPCITWEIEHSPHKLPALPPLPSLHGYVADSEQDAPKLVQIAALDNHIIGLTNYGHVLKHGFLSDETNASRGQWEYLPNFSQTDLIKEDSIFATGKASLSQDLKITHITAHYLSFTAYSTGGDSIVLMGNADTTPDSRPQIIPELQNKSVISVILGDYHKGAVTSDGKLFTWGAFSSGALGLGDPASLPLGSPGGFPIVQNRAHQARRMMRLPEPVETPTEVRFDHKRTTKRKKFCIFAAAAGWHTGAVVIDQESDDDNEEESEPVTDVAQSHQMPSHPTGHPIRGPGETPPFVPGPGLGIFRIGLAGAGAFSSQGGAGPSNPSPQSHLRRRQEDFGFSDESHDT